MTSLIALGRVLHLCEGLALKLSALLMIALLALMNVEIVVRYLFGSRRCSRMNTAAISTPGSCCSAPCICCAPTST